MIAYAQIDGAGMVVGVSQLAGQTIDPSLVELTEYSPDLLGKIWQGGGTPALHGQFADPPSPPVLNIILPGSPVSAGVAFNYSADVRDSGAALVPINDTYYVPIIRDADGWQAYLLVVDVVNGEAAGSVTIPDPGVYVLRLDKVRPTPQSQLSQNPEIIVTD